MKTLCEVFAEESAWKSADTFWARIYIAGDISAARIALQRECWRQGLCVTLHPCDYIYTGGAESGMCVGLVNYPRFPAEPAEITDRAKLVADLLLACLAQSSAMVVTPKKTLWMTRKPENVKL